MSFFKAYDMRGTFGVDFDLDTVFRVGRALPEVVKGRRWLVGRDCRETSEAVRDRLVAGLREVGAEVIDLGLCTTPMVYFFTAEDGYDGSVMITASHNPPGDNGLKVSRRGALPVGYADGLDRVERIVGGEEVGSVGSDAAGRRVHEEALARYVAWQRSSTPDFNRTIAQSSNQTIKQSNNQTVKQSSNQTIKQSNNQTIKQFSYAVDCSNGMASLLVKDLFPGAVVINDTLDGRFPNHSPNPLKAEAREQLAALVRERGLDCGVIFDGDADRCMFVDERGEFVQPDYLIPVLASQTIKQSNNQTIPKVLHDVRTSRGAIEAIRRLGCEPVMVPVGHAFAKPILRESGALCGGELAGHYYFREFHCCDSGVLAARRILCEIAEAKAEGRTFSELMAPICRAYENSGELNFRVDDKDAAIARILDAAARELPREVARSEMDGIRVEYDEGWFNVRKSNTEPYLRLLVERKADVDGWVRIFRRAIEHDA